MRYEIETGGAVRQVTVRPTGDGFAVEVDGRLHHVDAARIGPLTMSLIVDRVWQRDTVVAPEGAPGHLSVRVGAVPIVVRMDGHPRRGTHDARAAGSGLRRIVAPMPGKVVRVLVSAGQRVLARQPVVVVEAMKMENELRTDRDGTVAEIHAREGTSVEAGALLVVIQ